MTSTHTTIQTWHDRRISIDHYDDKIILEVARTDTGQYIGSTLDRHEARQLAAALTGGSWSLQDVARLRASLANQPPSGGQWTRDDLPTAAEAVTAYLRGRGSSSLTTDALSLPGLHGILDVVVEHLNAHYPKPDAGPIACPVHRERIVALEAARDAAVARAEQAERERDQAVEACALFQRDMHKWRERAEAAEARTAPAVTRAEVEKAIKGELVGSNVTLPDDLFELQIDAVCDLFGVEAEAVVDPVEAKAREEADRRYSGDPNHAFIEGAVWAARHALGQEADQ